MWLGTELTIYDSEENEPAWRDADQCVHQQSDAGRAISERRVRAVGIDGYKCKSQR